MPDQDPVIPERDWRKLLAAASGDSALLYLYLRAGGTEPQAKHALRMSDEQCAAASSFLRQSGLWEDKMQNIVYDYMTNSGPIKVVTVCDDKNDERYGKEVDTKSYTGPTKQVLKDRRQGTHPRLGHSSKSTLYDVLGYIDKDAEKWYASWVKENGAARIKESIQNVDIYNGLYDID
jgi:hypothetical protein